MTFKDKLSVAVFLPLLAGCLLMGCNSGPNTKTVPAPPENSTNSGRFIITSSTVYVIESQVVWLMEVQDTKGSNDFLIGKTHNGVSLQPVSRVGR